MKTIFARELPTSFEIATTWHERAFGLTMRLSDGRVVVEIMGARVVLMPDQRIVIL